MHLLRTFRALSWTTHECFENRLDPNDRTPDPERLMRYVMRIYLIIYSSSLRPLGAAASLRKLFYFGSCDRHQGLSSNPAVDRGPSSFSCISSFLLTVGTFERRSTRIECNCNPSRTFSSNPIRRRCWIGSEDGELRCGILDMKLDGYGYVVNNLILCSFI